MRKRVATGMIALVACTQEAAPFVGVPCTSLRLTTREDVSYLQIRRLLSGFNTVHHTQGQPCTDPECAAALAKFEQYSTPETDEVCPSRQCPAHVYAIAVRGGRAELLTTAQQLRDVLHAIETPQDAWLLATSANAHPLICDDPGHGMLPQFATYRHHTASFELRELRYTNGCPVTLSEILYDVGLDGQVRASEQVVISVEDACVSH